MAERKDAVLCVRAAERVAEAETSDHVHLRKQETVSQWGPGSIGLSGRLLEPFEALATGRGETRPSQK